MLQADLIILEKAIDLATPMIVSPSFLQKISSFIEALIVAVKTQMTATIAICLLIVGSNACDDHKKKSQNESKPENLQSRASIRSSPESAVTTRQLVSRLSKRSPNGTLSYDSMQMLKELAVSNPSLALEAYTRDAKSMNYEGFPEIAGLIAKHHPEFISEWLGSDLGVQVEDSDDRQIFVSFLLAALAAEDSTAALNSFEGLLKTEFADAQIMDRLKKVMLSRMGATNPEDAVSQITARFEGQQLNAALLAVARGVGVKDIDSALAIIDRISSPQEKLEGMALLLGETDLRDYTRIAPAIGKMEGGKIMDLIQADRSGALSEILYKSDLESVRRALDTTVLTDQNSSSFARYVNSAATQDPSAAFKFVMNFPESQVRDGMLVPAFAIWSRKDMDTAMDTVLGMDGNAKNEALRGIAGVAGTRGIEFMTAAAAKLDTDSRARFIADSIGSAAKVNFQESLDYVNCGQFMRDSENEGTRSAVIQAVGQHYAVKDPAAAFQWIATLGKESQAQAMEAYATIRAKTDMVSLAEQLGNMPQDANWKVGVGVLISNLRKSDPARAEQWEQALKGK